ncbi:hypothetical protein PENTCL1PPCAC_5464, partial [Pristionchus entomophagus]
SNDLKEVTQPLHPQWEYDVDEFESAALYCSLEHLHSVIHREAEATRALLRISVQPEKHPTSFHTEGKFIVFAAI